MGGFQLGGFLDRHSQYLCAHGFKSIFWRLIVYTLPNMDFWIVEGDFNSLEMQADQQGRGLTSKALLEERRHLGALPFHYGWSCSFQ